MKARLCIALAAACVIVLPDIALAASANETVTINATVAARARLTITPTTINFPDADPDVVNPIPANENAVDFSAKVRTGPTGAVTLTCLANGDLTDGGTGATIPIAGVTWTVAGGADFVPGTMSSAASQNVAGWTGPAQKNGQLNFFLANDWSYAVGSYTQTVDYTLTAP
jgi:hypothetical protein